MGRYAYQGQCQGGTAIDGTIEAASRDQAAEQLEAMRVRVIELKEADRARPRRGVGYDDFIFFNDQLASLAGSGLALDRGLREIAADIRSKRLRGVIHRIADDLERGVPLDQAVAAEESRLPVLYSRVIRAGVQGNQLSATLLNLSQHLRFLGESRRLAVEALAYPLTVLFMALGIFSVIVVWLLPQFEAIVRDFDAMIPEFTRWVFAFGHVYPWVLLAVAAMVVSGTVAWIALRFTEKGRRVRERALLAVPVVGTLIRSSLQARFFRAVALAVHGGLPLPATLRLAAGATGSPGLAQDAERAADRLAEGEPVVSACKGAGLIPPMFGYVAQVTADRNDLPEAMAQLARLYEQRALHQQGMLRAWLMPAAVILVAVAIGACILAIFWPLSEVLEAGSSFLVSAGDSRSSALRVMQEICA